MHPVTKTPEGMGISAAPVPVINIKKIIMKKPFRIFI
jgi:hypothetical protein